MAGRKIIKDKQTGELKAVPRKTPPVGDTVFRRLEEILPRENLIDLFGGNHDERFQQLYRFMCDPNLGKQSLPELASKCGLSYAQVLQAIVRGHLDQGMVRMSQHASDVMEDVAIDSRSKTVMCVTCNGTGQTTKGEEVVGCHMCDGVGELRKIGDIESRKIMFQTLRLTGGNAQTQVNVNVNNSTPMEDTVATLGEVLDVKPEGE